MPLLGVELAPRAGVEELLLRSCSSSMPRVWCRCPTRFRRLLRRARRSCRSRGRRAWCSGRPVRRFGRASLSLLTAARAEARFASRVAALCLVVGPSAGARRGVPWATPALRSCSSCSSRRPLVVDVVVVGGRRRGRSSWAWLSSASWAWSWAWSWWASWCRASSLRSALPRRPCRVVLVVVARARLRSPWGRTSLRRRCFRLRFLPAWRGSLRPTAASPWPVRATLRRSAGRASRAAAPWRRAGPL